jgi:hypothetical protein
MESSSLSRHGVRIIREIQMAPTGTLVTLVSRFEQTGPHYDKPLAVWSVTQVPRPKYVLVHVPRAPDRQRLLATPHEGFALREVGGAVLQIDTEAGGGKMGMDADMLASVHDDLVFLQRQVTVGRDDWAPETRAQLYVHPAGATNVPPEVGSYAELEWTTPSVPPQRVSDVPLKVTWELATIALDAAPADVERRRPLPNSESEPTKPIGQFRSNQVVGASAEYLPVPIRAAASRNAWREAAGGRRNECPDPAE